MWLPCVALEDRVAGASRWVCARIVVRSPEKTLRSWEDLGKFHLRTGPSLPGLVIFIFTHTTSLAGIFFFFLHFEKIIYGGEIHIT